MKDKKYILFDLDGTLTDPGEGITNSVEYALKKYGIDVEDKTRLYKFIGPPLIDSFMNFYGFSKEKAIQAVEFYREYFRVTGIFENLVYEGIPELLEELNKAGKMVVLATSKPEDFAKQILEHFQLSEYFCFVAGATMSETRTHKHEVISYALKELGISDISSAVMVGDREMDIIGAHKSGLKAIGVLYGYGSGEELEKAGADYIVKDVAELKRILLS